MKIEDYYTFSGSQDTFINNYLTPVFYGGEFIPDYYVDPDGYIWSFKKNTVRILSWFFNKGKQYPRVSLCFGDKVLKVLVHRIVCETFHVERPLPEGVTEDEWKRTPKSVKAHFEHYWEVNHKDHIKTNFHPDNLEWVSCKQNIDRYVEHLQKNKA
jgi:hypothetical protein